MLAFHDKFLGPNNVDHINKQGKQKLLSLSYQAERRNWTFKRFVTEQKDQNIILEGLTDHMYFGLDARKKVTRLLYGIKTDSLDTVIANITEDSKKRR